MATLPDVKHTLDVDETMERRDSWRTRTIYRLVRVQNDEDEGLARCRNISDGGMRLQLKIPVMLNERVEVAFSPTVRLTGRVAWTNGDECGLAFDEPIDSVAMLGETAAEARQDGFRAPRLKTSIPAALSVDGNVRAAEVGDISQYGMKVTHDGSFQPGLTVKVLLASGQERRGVIRWTMENLAGLQLLEPLSVEELGSIKALSAASGAGETAALERRLG